MAELLVESTLDNGKKIYAMHLLKVAGVSQYNSDDLRFEGIEGFWKMSDRAKQAAQGRIPPEGTIAWFKLAGGNPKRSANARPGSVYLDIEDVAPASEEDKARYTTPSLPQSAQQAPPWGEPPREAYNASPQATGGDTAIQSRISKGQALSIRATMFAGLIQATDKRLDALGVTTEQLEEEMNVLIRAILVLESGRQPTHEELFAIQPETEEPEAEATEEPEAEEPQSQGDLAW